MHSEYCLLQLFLKKILMGIITKERIAAKVCTFICRYMDSCAVVKFHCLECHAIPIAVQNCQAVVN
jgi:hypothetical protein